MITFKRRMQTSLDVTYSLYMITNLSQTPNFTYSFVQLKSEVATFRKQN